MKFPTFLFSLLILVPTSCSNNQEKSAIVGTWKLVEFANLDSSTNQWQYPFGEKPRGFFTYTANGIVNLNISNENPLELPADSLNSTTFVYNEFMDNAVGYFGKYEVSFENSTVTHKVEGGTIPFYIGTEQPRPFRLNGDTLTIGDGKTWRRVLVKVAD